MSDGRVKKQFYRPRHTKKFYLEPGQRGFFCTCNFREKDCVKEAYNLLFEYGDKLYGPPQNKAAEVAKKPAAEAGGTDAPEAEDISVQLKKELDDMKHTAKKDIKERRFQAVETDVSNCVFIRTSLPKPEEVTNEIFKNLMETKAANTRFLLRMLPIMATCKANMHEVTQTAGRLFDEHFLKEPTTFSIIFNRRFHSTLTRDDVIKELADLITLKNSGNKANLKAPKKAVIVELIKGICLLSVVENFYEYRKYNMFEICKKEEKSEGVKENEDSISDKAPDEKMEAANGAADGENVATEASTSGKGDEIKADTQIENSATTEKTETKAAETGDGGGGDGGK